MKRLIILFLIISPITILFAQWYPDDSFPVYSNYSTFQGLRYFSPNKLVLIEHEIPPPPPHQENNIIYSKSINDTVWNIIYSGGALGNIFFLNSNIVYSAGSSLYKSIDGGMSWNQVFDFRNIYPSGDVYDLLFKDEQTGYVVGTTGGSYPDIHGFFGRTYNGGVTWNLQIISSTESCSRITCVNDSVLFITGFYSGYGKIFKSTDNGENWVKKNDYTVNWFFKLYFINEENGWALGAQGKILKTTDFGESWQDISPNSYDNYFDCYFFDSEIGWVVGSQSGPETMPVIRTTNGGISWTSYLDVSTAKQILFMSPDTGFILTDYQIFKTTNSGLPVELISFTAEVLDYKIILNWSTATETNNHGFEIQRKAEGTNWLTIGFKEGKGTTTESQSYSFTDKDLQPGKYSYRLKQVDFNGTYKYSDVVEVEVALATFSLSQNYPNPFNPSTTIKYSIGNVGTSFMKFVQLKVYDVLGNEVATLVNEEKPAGSYTVEFNGGNLASGIYFYQLKTGSYTATKKLILLK